MGKLLPNQEIIYESDGNIIYGRYVNIPQIEPWIVSDNRSIISYIEWSEMCELSHKNDLLKSQLEKTLNIFYMIKGKK